MRGIHMDASFSAGKLSAKNGSIDHIKIVIMYWQLADLLLLQGHFV